MNQTLFYQNQPSAKTETDHQPSTKKPVKRENADVFSRLNSFENALEREKGCSRCGKKGCCDDDHRPHGVLIGMGF
ncbi:MAG: hypothetical protein V1793_07705 [Pseudomonadota bacterium]